MYMYFIAGFEKLETDKLGWPDTGDIRVFGYKETLEKAVEALNNNVCDMHETIYNYAVIEKLAPRIHPDVEEAWYFKYDKERDGFFEIEKPKILNAITNLTIG